MEWLQGEVCEREAGGKLQPFWDAQSIFSPELRPEKNKHSYFNQEV